jgi:opacity protein-like surface antigen
MRTWVVVACLTACGAATLSAQERSWSGALAVGYGQGAGAFDEKGAVWTTVAGFTALSPIVRGGLELGYHRFGSTVSSIPDVYGPGSLIREDYRRSFWQASATMRLRAGGAWRPYAGTGLGAYLVHVHDHIVTRDPSGSEIPGLQFDQTAAEVKPGAHLLAGVERARVFGRAGLGIQARWDGILAGGLGNVLSVGLVVTLD